MAVLPAAGAGAAVLPIPILRVAAWAGTNPTNLPSAKPAAVALRLGFTSEEPGEPAPELTGIALDLNRHITIQTAGLPSCPLPQLYYTVERARRECGSSLVGHGSVTSEITLPGQQPAAVTGRLLAFYSLAEGTPRILAQVSTGEPLPLTYVIPFQLHQVGGAFGTGLVVHKMHNIRGRCASGHPNCFAQPYTLKGVYSRISKLRLTLWRRFRHAGGLESFVRATCPATPGHRGAALPFARVKLSYFGGLTELGTVTWNCQTSGGSRTG